MTKTHHCQYLLDQRWLHAGLLILLFFPAFAQTVFLDSTVRFDYLSGDTVPTRKEIFQYDQMDREIEVVVQTRKLNENQWQNSSRTTTSYAGDWPDTITEWEYSMDHFRPSERLVLSRTDTQLVTISQIWIDGAWTNRSKVTEDRSQSIGSYRVSCQWSSDRWMVVDSQAIKRNIHRQITSDTQYVYVPLFDIYLPRAYSFRNYDPLNQLIEHQRFEYSADSMSFLPRSRDTFGYDQAGFQIFSRFDLWLESENAWDPSLQIIRTKNEYGLLDSSKLFFQDFVSGELRPTSRLEHQYFSGPITNGSDTILRRVKNVIYQGPFEVPDWVRWYFYQPLTTAVKYLIPEVSIYPNPASDMVYLKTADDHFEWYRLFNMEGQLIQDGALRGNHIRLPNLTTADRYIVLQLLDKHNRYMVHKLLLIHK